MSSQQPVTEVASRCGFDSHFPEVCDDHLLSIQVLCPFLNWMAFFIFQFVPNSRWILDVHALLEEQLASVEVGVFLGVSEGSLWVWNDTFYLLFACVVCGLGICPGSHHLSLS